ncbi:hypothetical protein ACQ4PT_013823 [Festuca glaucescens]
MASNGGAPYPWPPPALPSGECYTCPWCRATWGSKQALGGHMSSGRCKNAPARQPLPPPPPPPPPRPRNISRLLPPNPAFWAEYRRGGQRPVQMNFLGLPATLLNDNEPEPSNNVAMEPEVNDDAEDGSVSPLNLNLGL